MNLSIVKFDEVSKIFEMDNAPKFTYIQYAIKGILEQSIQGNMHTTYKVYYVNTKESDITKITQDKSFHYQEDRQSLLDLLEEFLEK